MSFGFRSIIMVLPLGLALGGILCVLLIVKQPGRFPLRIIEIQNELKWLKPEAISQVVSPNLEQGFFGIDVEAVQKQINQLPWVANSDVQRVWSDKLFITITEQNPLARWGDAAILSTEGKIFYPESIDLPMGSPWFKGPEKAAVEMLKQYLDFLEMLSPLGLSIAELNLSDEGSYKILLDNGIAIILGKTALNERLSRFILVYPNQLKKEIERIAYLDLRYTNGMAIGWKANMGSGSSHHLNNTIMNHAHMNIMNDITRHDIKMTSMNDASINNKLYGGHH